jgi:preprotein translocase subunit YajC
MDNLWIVAQADLNQAPSRVGSQPLTAQGQQGTATVQDANGNPQPGQTKPGSPWGGGGQLLFFAALMVVLFILMIRPQRKQQREQKQMIQSLKKNDRVRTIGGILGTVMEVRGDEVILKIDEQNNTRIHVSVSAIGKNLSPEEKS